MDFDLYSHLSNYSTHTQLSACGHDNIDQKKSERLTTKDSEWSELHTITTAGYIHNPKKFGFDGFDESRGVHYEVKSSSKIIDRGLIKKFADGTIVKRNEFIHNPIDGRGVFSLMTHDAYQRHLNHPVNMLVSAYINGVLMFIIEFPFSHPTFNEHINRILEKALPGGDSPGKSKTVSFTYSQYKDCKSARLVYMTQVANQRILKGACTKNFYNYLVMLAKHKTNTMIM
jgi:hypothetical protein